MVFASPAATQMALKSRNRTSNNSTFVKGRTLPQIFAIFKTKQSALDFLKKTKQKKLSLKIVTKAQIKLFKPNWKGKKAFVILKK